MAPESWRAADADIAAIAGALHADPFAVLGPHQVAGGHAIRAFVPGAEGVTVLDANGARLADLAPRGAGAFEGLVRGPFDRAGYRLRARRGADTWTFRDPYAHGPVLGPMDDYLLVEGTHDFEAPGTAARRGTGILERGDDDFEQRHQRSPGARTRVYQSVGR